MCSPRAAKVAWRHFILVKGIQTKYLTLLSPENETVKFNDKGHFFLHFSTVCLGIKKKKKAFFSDQQQSWKQTMKDMCVCVY